MDIAAFRTSLPEFSDPTAYPNSMITFWSGLGEKLIDADRAGAVFTECLYLFTAHNIALASRQVKTAATGGALAGAGGAVSSKAVGSASVSYDTAGAMEPDAGHWNQTIYGRQYVRLIRLVGMGCVQL
jgi:hypothetical protein